MMQFHSAYTGFRETLDSDVFNERSGAPPWQNPTLANQNKQIDVYQGRALTSYTEIAREEQDQLYNWYHTVPLTHVRNYPQNINLKETLHNEFDGKGRMPHERQKRYRTSFTTFQLSRLEEEFNKDMYAVGMKRMRLAGELNLTEKQVKVWFQNRRMKYKRVCQRLHNRRIAAHKLWAH